MHRSAMRWFLGVVVMVGGSGPAAAWDADGDPCQRSQPEAWTDSYYFSASSAQGAVGDVVGIDFFLTVDEWIKAPFAFGLVLCYDGTQAELVGDPLFSEYYDRLVFISYTHPLGGEVGPQHFRGELGFTVVPNMHPEVAEDLLGGGDPYPLMTLYFRIQGNPGDVVPLRFCSGEFAYEAGNCLDNLLLMPGEVAGRTLQALSSRHVSGQIRVLPGEATHPEVPDLPPSAKVYPEAPTAETAHVLFELTGEVARPGSVDVPLDVYITSSHEFTSYSFGLAFPPELVSITRVEERIRPGAVAIDNDNGTVGALLQDSTRRIGREGERVRIATIYASVSETADVEEIPFRFEKAGPFKQWVGIRHTRGMYAESLPIATEVAPLELVPALLKLQLEGTTPGDANLDYTLDLSDAVEILGYLFLGHDDLACLPAADVNADGTINLTDPVDLLLALFGGASVPDSREVFCTLR